MVTVYGAVVDSATRCVHYHTDVDIIAIKFKCCGRYFPCFQCHNEERGHEVERWNWKDLENEEVVLCGSCKKELTFSEYNDGQAQCKFCLAQFNPKCALHYDLYFDLKKETQ